MNTSTLTTPTHIERALVEMLPTAASEIARYADSLADRFDTSASDCITIQQNGIEVCFCFETSWDFNYYPETYDSPAEFDKTFQSVDICDIQIATDGDYTPDYEIEPCFLNEYMNLLEEMTNKKI